MLTIESVIARLALSFSKLIPVLFIIATAWFFVGVIYYLISEDERKERGRRIIVQGIIALAVMVAVWALVYVLITFVFNDPNPSPFIPGNDIVDKI